MVQSDEAQLFPNTMHVVVPMSFITAMQHSPATSNSPIYTRKRHRRLNPLPSITDNTFPYYHLHDSFDFSRGPSGLQLEIYCHDMA